jgi:hypothetical protein
MTDKDYGYDTYEPLANIVLTDAYCGVWASDNENRVFVKPIAGFALMKHVMTTAHKLTHTIINQEIERRLCAMTICDGELCPCDEASNFFGVVCRPASDREIKSLLPKRAQDWVIERTSMCDTRNCPLRHGL